jgi:prepilin-type N-terminal cleavage/methylation domain-containing protein
VARRLKSLHGFTLVETMIAAAITGFILAAVLVCATSMLRVYTAADENYKGGSAQTRVLDYIARDLRQALSGTVSNGGQRLTINLPNYIDSSIQPPAEQRRTPAVVSGTVTYGNAADSITVAYYMNGASIVRQQTTVSAGVTSTTQASISSDDEAFQLTFADPSNPGSTADFSFAPGGSISSVKATISFMPKFTRLNLDSSRAATTVSATTILRYGY